MRAKSRNMPPLSALQDSTLHTDLEQEMRRSGDQKLSQHGVTETHGAVYAYLRTIKPIVNHVPEYKSPEESN